VSVTKEGYIKRTSLRSFSASNKEDLMMKSTDNLVRLIELDTTDHVLLFTNFGKYVCIPIHELSDIRWKDMGNHLSNITTFDTNEQVIQCIPVREFTKDTYITFVTKNGMVKKTELDTYQSPRYSRSLIALNLREEDELVSVFTTNGNEDVFIATHLGYGLWFNESEVSPVGQRALGVIGIQLKENDFVVNGLTVDEANQPNLIVTTQRGACKRMKLTEFERSTRARRGTVMLRELKTKPHRLIGFFALQKEDQLIFKTDKEEEIITTPYELPVSDRTSNGSFIIDVDTAGNIIAVTKDTVYERLFTDELL